MNKVTLPKEIADAMDRTFQHKTKEQISWAVFNIIKLNDANLTSDSVIIKNYFKNEDLFLLMEALVNGYEVEQTPEEKVREYFERVMNTKAPLPHIAVVATLDLLGIKISGVND